MGTRFEGKTVIVTGGNSGIGEATAVAFAREGARVIVTGRRSDAVAATEALHPNITGVVADVQSDADAHRVVGKAVGFGGLDVLVNNAGIGIFEPLAALDPEHTQSQFGINVLGLMTFTHAALGALAASKGSIVNISSVVGNAATPGGSAYAATKAAVNSLTRSWAVELASQGVRVNAVAPGPVETPIFGKTGMSEQEIKAFKSSIVESVPLARIGQPEEIAYWVLNVADPAAGWVTGQIIGVDGGKSA